MKYIQTLVFCLSILISAKSNNIITNSSQWVFCYRDSLGSPFYSYNVYKFLKDTLIQDKVCKYIECDSNKYDVIVYENDKQIFYYQNGGFKLLYDFSVKENDTVYLDIRAVSFRIIGEQVLLIDTTLSVKSIVTKIDSIMASGTVYLKRVTVNIYPEADFLINSTWPETISYIEKLGYTMDGFIPIIIRGFTIAINHNRDLRCYSEENFSFMTDFWKQSSKDCYYKKQTSIADNKINSIDLYPNPFTDIVNISLNDEIKVNDAILVEIIDCAGKAVFKPFFIYSNNIILSLDYLKKGLYFIIFKDYNRGIFYVNKLIRQ